MLQEQPYRWPERPTCHAPAGEMFKIGNTFAWRDAEPDGNKRSYGGRFLSPYATPYRTCDYCGSIHPEDLLTLVSFDDKVVLDGADWKYGWPHKFYVKNIPNTIVGQKVVKMSSSVPKGEAINRDTDIFKSSCQHEGCEEHGYWSRIELGDAPAFVQAKWYSEHLKDITDEATFSAMTDMLFKKTGVIFRRREGGELQFHAPGRGARA